MQVRSVTGTSPPLPSPMSTLHDENLVSSSLGLSRGGWLKSACWRILALFLAYVETYNLLSESMCTATPTIPSNSPRYQRLTMLLQCLLPRRRGHKSCEGVPFSRLRNSTSRRPLPQFALPVPLLQDLWLLVTALHYVVGV